MPASCFTAGEGWFGWVVSGRVKSSPRPKQVVVKILKDGASEESIKLFKNQYQMFADIDHVNVMETFGRCFDSFPLLAVVEDAEHRCVKSFLLQCENDQDIELALKLSRLVDFGVSCNTY